MLIRSFPPTAKRDARLAVTLALSIGLHLFAFGHLAQLFQPEMTDSEQSENAPWTARPGPGPLLVHLDAAPAPVALPAPHTPEVASSAPNQGAGPLAGHLAPVRSITESATAASPATRSGTTDEGADVSLQSYLKPSQVDMATHPLNAPNVSDLGPPESLAGQSVRLRIYVDSAGRVAHIDALPPSTALPEIITKIEQAVSATQFIPARLDNQPVASYTVVDLSVGALQVLPADRLIR